jgi:choline dehydrogenase-like flavoprotein
LPNWPTIGLLVKASEAGDDRVLVIGSGPCGAIAARQLVNAGVNVTMLEAGQRPPAGLLVRVADRTLVRWRSPKDLSTGRHGTAGDPATEWYSTLSPGGLSNYWTAAVPRFAPEDFTDGSRLDERFDWPVRYDEMIPYYEIAEDLLAISGPQHSLSVLPAGRISSLRIMPPDWRLLAGDKYADSLTMMPLARGSRWMVACRGSEFNSYHVIVKPLEAASSFELRLGARVTRLLVSDAGNRVTGAEYVDIATGARKLIRARAIVLAAGTIDSTRILLSSPSSSSPEGIGNETGLVGRYLHDHPKEWWPAEFERPLTALEHPAYLARPPYDGSRPLSGASATIGLHSQRDRPRSFLGRTTRRFGVQVFGSMVPSEQFGMRLLDSQSDGFGLPKIELNIRYDNAALDSLGDARQRFEAVFADAGNPVRAMPIDWVPRPGSSVHFVGTVRMHQRPDLGVLDRWNRVHQTPNLIVADLSCFPTNPEKNPTLTAMALAARAADKLASDS